MNNKNKNKNILNNKNNENNHEIIILLLPLKIAVLMYYNSIRYDSIKINILFNNNNIDHQGDIFGLEIPLRPRFMV